MCSALHHPRCTSPVILESLWWPSTCAALQRARTLQHTARDAVQDIVTATKALPRRRSHGAESLTRGAQRPPHATGVIESCHPKTLVNNCNTSTRANSYLRCARPGHLAWQSTPTGWGGEDSGIRRAQHRRERALDRGCQPPTCGLRTPDSKNGRQDKKQQPHALKNYDTNRGQKFCPPLPPRHPEPLEPRSHNTVLSPCTVTPGHRK